MCYLLLIKWRPTKLLKKSILSFIESWWFFLQSIYYSGDEEEVSCLSIKWCVHCPYKWLLDWTWRWASFARKIWQLTFEWVPLLWLDSSKLRLSINFRRSDTVILWLLSKKSTVKCLIKYRWVCFQERACIPEIHKNNQNPYPKLCGCAYCKYYLYVFFFWDTGRLFSENKVNGILSSISRRFFWQQSYYRIRSSKIYIGMIILL